MEPADLREQLTGLLAFPVTPFGPDGELDLARFREHVDFQLSTAARAVFVVCGTGEFFSVTIDEHRRLVAAATDVAQRTKPVIAGVGYGARIAAEMARNAEAAGADGVLVLPPYLVKSEQDGLYQHYQQIAQATSLGVILYQRGNAILAPSTIEQLSRLPNVIGFKDGFGDVDHLARIRLVCDDQLLLMNGMPTAEVVAAALGASGVQSYSSAVLNFVPEIAESFYHAMQRGDAVAMDRLLHGFFLPLVDLRDEKAGYSVSLVKAGVNARYEPVGDPRPPLTVPAQDAQERLKQLIERGLDLL